MRIIRPTAIGDTAFTRASTATYWDANGVLQTAAIDVLRPDYDPVTGEWRGSIIELASTNLLLHSNALSTSPWTGTCSVATDGTLCPDGVSLAWKVSDTDTGATQFWNQEVSVASSTNTRVASIFVKKGNSRYINIETQHFTGGTTINRSAYIDLDTGTQTGGTATDLRIETLIDGWFRLSLSSTDNGTGNTKARLLVRPTASSVTLDNSLIGHTYFAEAQMEVGSHVTSYIDTTTTAVTRSADVVTGNGLVYTNIPETEHTEWSSVATYNLGDKVRVTDAGIHRVYESLIGSNTNKYPPDNTTGATPAWLDTGPTNRWGMFDAQVGTVTSNVNEIVVTLNPGICDSIALFNLDAAEVEVSVFHPDDGEIFSQTINLVSSEGITDWYTYFFEPIAQRTDLALFDLNAYTGSYINVAIRKSGSTVQCGGLVVGRKRDFGRVRYGAQLGIIDYSRKERDTFGRPIIVERDFSKRASVELLIEDRMVDVIHQTLSQYRATPIVWAFAEEYYSSTLIYGYYRDFSIVIQYPTYSACLLDIEGLT